MDDRVFGSCAGGSLEGVQDQPAIWNLALLAPTILWPPLVSGRDRLVTTRRGEFCLIVLRLQSRQHDDFMDAATTSMASVAVSDFRATVIPSLGRSEGGWSERSGDGCFKPRSCSLLPVSRSGSDCTFDIGRRGSTDSVAQQIASLPDVRRVTFVTETQFQSR